MSDQRTNRRALRFGIEQSYNAEAVPSNMGAILVNSIDTTPLAGQDIERGYIRPYYGNAPQAPGEKHVQVVIGVELTTSGEPGTPPPWGPLLRACGWSETIVPASGDDGARVVYAPVSDNEDSGRFYCHVDKNLHEGRGARGTVQFTLNAESIPVMQITLMALVRPVVNANLPEVDLSAWHPAEPINNENTSQLKVHGHTASFSQFSLDMAAQTRHRTVVGANDVAITGRSPSGSMQIDDPGVASVNFFERSQQRTPGVIEFVHGKAAGKTLVLNQPNTTLGAPSYADDQGMQMLTIPYTPEPVQGNDEVTLTIR